MKLRGGIVMVGGLACCIMLGVVLLRRDSEPRFKGKTVTRWIETTSPFPDDEAVNAFGPDACPYLIHVLRRNQSPLNQIEWALWKALPSSAQIRYSWLRPVDVRGSRSCAHAWLKALGPDAKSAIPELLEVARRDNDHFERSAAVNTVGMIGADDPGLVQALLPLLKDADTVVADAAALSIPPFGPSASHAVPTLVELIRANRPGKPFNPVMAFTFMGPAGSEAAPALLSALKDQQLEGNVLTALVGIGSGAEAAVPAMIELAKAKDADKRAHALHILMNIGPPAKTAIPVLKEIEAKETNVLGVLAAAAIGRIEGPADYAVPTLRAALDPGRFSRTPPWSMFLPTGQSTLGSAFGLAPDQAAAWLLAEIGPPAKAALPDLEAAMLHGNSWLRILSARAIWSISKDGAATASVLSEAFRLSAPRQKDELTFFIAGTSGWRERRVNASAPIDHHWLGVPQPRRSA
jgi:HEAT repeat protein